MDAAYTSMFGKDDASKFMKIGAEIGDLWLASFLCLVLKRQVCFNGLLHLRLLDAIEHTDTPYTP